MSACWIFSARKDLVKNLVKLEVKTSSLTKFKLEIKTSSLTKLGRNMIISSLEEMWLF